METYIYLGKLTFKMTMGENTIYSCFYYLRDDNDGQKGWRLCLITGYVLYSWEETAED